MKVRPAVPADAEAIERIRIRGWQAAYRHVFPPEELDGLPIDWTRWRASLERPEPGHATFVADASGCVHGWATIGPSSLTDRCGELRGLYVDPERWSRGVGRTLLARAEAELGRNWDQAVLWTLEDNPRTRLFYEAAGWHTDGETGTLERLGVAAPVVRYVKRLSSSTSRS
jgi:GNAT superfamily N-acetyltransferase